MRSALGLGLISHGAAVTPPLRAQTPPASPIPPEESLDPTESVLPPGITIATDGELAAGPPVSGGGIRLVRPGPGLGNFNPSAFAQDLQIPLSYLEPLVRPDPTTLRPAPCLAEEWEWRADGLELALTIRNDVVWHDETPLSAADAVFSYEVYGEDTDSEVRGLFDLVDSIEAVSDREIRVLFTTRDANWLFNAATLPIISSRQYREFWNEMSPVSRTLSSFDWSKSVPVGTGPWRISEWDSSQIRFERFARYWGTGPWLDELVVGVQEGARSRLEAWETGGSQIVWPVRSHEIQELDDSAGMIFAAPAASVMFAAFNFANPDQPAGSLWTDLRIRRAVSQAVNRERYADEIFDGFIRWNATGTVSQPWAHDSTLVTPDYNPDGASVLLAEAGWLDYYGDGVREDVNGLQLRPVAILRDDSRPELAAVMARIVRDLAEVGIALAVEMLPAEAFANRWIVRRDYDLVAYAYDQLPGFTDFDLYGSAWDIRSNPAGWNPGGYTNAEADAAIQEFLGAVSIERQALALRRLQRAVDQDLFGLWLGFPDDLVLVAEGIEGFTPDMSWQTARTWDLWREPQRS